MSTYSCFPPSPSSTFATRSLLRAPGPTNQNPRPKPQNRAKAYRVLRARLLDRKLQAEQDERRSVRRTQVRGTDRSEKIRTYNFPQVRFVSSFFLLSLDCPESNRPSVRCRSGRDSFHEK